MERDERGNIQKIAEELSGLHRCINCGEEVENLLKVLLRGDYELTICKNCGMVADQFIEYEGNLLLLQLILCKYQYFRHLLYNSHIPQLKRLVFRLILMLIMLELLEAKVYHKFSGNDLLDIVVSLLSVILGNLVLLASLTLFIYKSGHREVGILKCLLAVIVSMLGKMGIILSLIWPYTEIFIFHLKPYVFLANLSALYGTSDLVIQGRS